MSNKIKIILASALAIIVMITVGFIYTILNKETIYNGVNIDGIEVGGLTKDEAVIHLKNAFQKDIESRTITLSDGEYSTKTRYKDLGIDYDYSKGINQAHNMGRNGNVFDRIKEIIDLSTKGKNITLEIKKDNKKIKELADRVSMDIVSEKKDATIRYSGGQFIITDEVIGRKVDVDKLLKDINKSILVSELIDIPVIEDKPKATREMLSQIRDEIGSYSTTFGTNDTNRVFNIRKAAASLDGMVVLPGEVFSFNKTTGPRSKQAGYKDATVIMNNEFVPGEGGGVCQVSSTLYNAALNSNVDIVERHAHSLPVGYVPEGRDATVAYDALDFKFKNSFNYPIYLKTDVVGNQLIIKTYGRK